MIRAVAGSALILCAASPLGAVENGPDRAFIIAGETVSGHYEISDSKVPGGWRLRDRNDPPMDMSQTLEWRGPVYRFVPDEKPKP